MAFFRCGNQTCFWVIKSLTPDQAQLLRLEECSEEIALLGVAELQGFTPRRVAYAGRACPEKVVLPGKGFDHRRRVEQKRERAGIECLQKDQVSEYCV